MLRKKRVHRLALATAAAIVVLAIELAAATLGGALPAPLPLFPVDNWWNVDVSSAPVDSASNAYITSSTTAAHDGCILTSVARPHRVA